MADCTILVMNESFDGPFDAVLDCGWSLFENFDSEWMPTSASEQEEKTNCNHCFLQGMQESKKLGAWSVYFFNYHAHDANF